MMQIRNALGILSSQVPIGNLLWVDPVNGIDAAAIRGRMTVPFRTLTAAKNAAQPASGSVPGDTIVVLPGRYNEKNLLKNGVNWHFVNGAIVEYTGAAAGGIFDTSANGTNAAVTSMITGYGEFNFPPSSSTGHVVNSAAGGSALFIECRSMTSTNLCVKVGSGASTLQIKALERILGEDDDAVSIAGGTNTIKADVINSSIGACLRIDGGGADVYAHRLECYTTAYAAVVVAGGSGTTTIHAYEISSSYKPCVKYTASSAYLAILGARLKTLATGADGNGIDINTSYGSDKVRIPQCVIVAAGDYTINASAANTQVHTLGGAAGNKAPHSNVIAIPFNTFWHSTSVT